MHYFKNTTGKKSDGFLKDNWEKVYKEK